MHVFIVTEFREKNEELKINSQLSIVGSRFALLDSPHSYPDQIRLCSFFERANLNIRAGSGEKMPRAHPA